MNDKPRPSKLDAAIKRAAAADTARIRADLDGLAARAELAGMPSRQVAAIRRAWDLYALVDRSSALLHGLVDDIAAKVAAAEENRDAAKARD